jgi:hypothetical protein
MSSGCCAIALDSSIQERLLQDIQDPRSTRTGLCLSSTLSLGSLQLSLQLHLSLDPLGLFSGVRDGRVDQRSDSVGQVGGLDSEGFGESPDLGLNVVVTGDDLTFGSLSSGLGLSLYICRKGLVSQAAHKYFRQANLLTLKMLCEAPRLAATALVALAAAETADDLAVFPPPNNKAQYPPASLAQTVTRQM